MKHLRCSGLVGGALALLVTGFTACAQEAPTREIVQVTGDLYRARNNNHHAVFLVTDEGIILSDPINTEFSEWLKSQFDDRFGLPVKYVIYSHHHWDHASGGAVFADTAVFVGHENMLHNLALPPTSKPLPANARDLDANRNGRLERAETAGNYRSRFHLYDADGDGTIGGAEAIRGPFSEVREPDVIYSDRMAISLGGKQVELIYPGDILHSDDMSIIRFPDERAIFVVDWISLRRVPYRTLGTGNLDAWLNGIRFVEALDYGHVVGGHGAIGKKSDVAAVRHYLEEMRDAVAQGIAEGLSLEELQENVLMDRYRNWENYDAMRTMNIEGMYNLLTQ